MMTAPECTMISLLKLGICVQHLVCFQCINSNNDILY